MEKYTLIHYFVPEDGDTQTDLNGYGIPKMKEHITLKDIKSTFPLKGKYTFRFLSKYNKTNIFIDLLNEDDSVPITDKRIVVKANRVSWTPAKPQSPKTAKTAPVEVKHKDKFDFEFN